MSLAALLEASLQHIRHELNLDRKRSGIEEDGQPPPWCGEVYYAVHPTQWTPGAQDPNDILDERFGLSVTITQRTAKYPQGGQRMEGAYLEAVKGLEERCRRVMLAMHLSYVVNGAANSLIDGTHKLCEPLRWRGTDAVPRKVDGTWFWAEPDAGSGLVMEVRFGDASRQQAIFKSGNPDRLD